MAQRHPDRAEAFLLRALETAHALGCSILGGVTYSALGFRSGEPPTEEEYANIARALKPVARRAAEFGMLLGVEPCNRYETHLLNTAEQSLAMLERIGEANVTIHLDAYHMNIEEKGIGRGIRAAGPRCAYLHLSKSDRGVPGTGTVDWPEVFRALAETRFSGDLVMESSVTLPPEIRRLFTEVERAKLEGLATLERARGEHAALRSLANAARMLKGNPELMNLRLLQALAAANGKRPPTLVLGQGSLLPIGSEAASSDE